MPSRKRKRGEKYVRERNSRPGRSIVPRSPPLELGRWPLLNASPQIFAAPHMISSAPFSKFTSAPRDPSPWGMVGRRGVRPSEFLKPGPRTLESQLKNLARETGNWSRRLRGRGGSIGVLDRNMRWWIPYSGIRISLPVPSLRIDEPLL